MSGLIGHRGLLMGDSLPTKTSGIINPFYPTVLYSLRKRNLSYSGACISVKRADGAVSDIGFGNNGYMDEIALSSFVGNGDANVITWYDQGGIGANLTDTTGVKIVSAGTVISINGHAAMLSTGQVLSAAENSAFAFGSGAYTIEMLYRPTASNNGQAQVLIDFRSASSNVGTLYNRGGNIPSFFDGSNNDNGQISVQSDTDSFEAISTDGSNLSIYYGNTRQLFAAHSSTYVGSRPISIGNSYNNSLGLSAYLLEIRITKGSAVYSGASISAPSYTS